MRVYKILLLNGVVPLVCLYL